MSKENVKNLFAEIEKNLELKDKYLQLIQAHQIETEKALDNKLVAFGKSAGFNFTAEEMIAASVELVKSEKTELSNADLNKVSGGAGDPGPYPTVQILQAAMAHRESIRKSFESQRAALLEAIEAQRQAILRNI